MTSLLHGFDDLWMMVIMMLVGLVMIYAALSRTTRAIKPPSLRIFWYVVGAAFFFSGFWNVFMFWFNLPVRPC